MDGESSKIEDGDVAHRHGFLNMHKTLGSVLSTVKMKRESISRAWVCLLKSLRYGNFQVLLRLIICLCAGNNAAYQYIVAQGVLVSIFLIDKYLSTYTNSLGYIN